MKLYCTTQTSTKKRFWTSSEGAAKKAAPHTDRTIEEVEFTNTKEGIIGLLNKHAG